MAEGNYEFRHRLGIIHKPERRNPGTKPDRDEIEITDQWKIVIDKKSDALIYNVARDLEDYLMVSMGVSVKLIRVDDISSCVNSCINSILLATKSQFRETCKKPDINRSYRFTVENGCVIVCGFEERGVAQGSYYLEDIMNIREAPFLKSTNVVREPLFQPRMIHSGWGIDEFPDCYLNSIAHAGIDAILLFANGVNSIPGPYRSTISEERIHDLYIDFKDIVNRASKFGIDVYMYSYIESSKHPDDTDAEEYYNSTYGRVFEECPGFKGLVLVGESCEFPSKDTNTSMLTRKEHIKIDIPPNKPIPGWWPCKDYPQWLNLIKKVVRKHNPHADIVFWTYNWGWAPEEYRLELLRNIPEDITLLVTFEMFEEYSRNGILNRCVDYTLAFEGPGKYFTSEAKVAYERGLKLYAMSNTGGMTWDFGVIPYEPAPYQWTRRHDALKESMRNYGLSGIMESHHYGWYPSFISDITKFAYWSPSPEPDGVYRDLARRDFSEEAVTFVLKSWECWSEAIRCYVPTNEDQYGPFRVGPSYPLSFKHVRNIPSMWHARFGNVFCQPDYQPGYNPIDSTFSLNGAKMGKEIEIFLKMDEKIMDGAKYIEMAISQTPEKKRKTGREMARIALFMHHCIITAVNVKKWWILKSDLNNEKNSSNINRILDEMVCVAEDEIRNAEETIPLVEEDSRLGWEPCMEYMCDVERIRRKIKLARNIIVAEIPEIRKIHSNTSESTVY